MTEQNHEQAQMVFSMLGRHEDTLSKVCATLEEHGKALTTLAARQQETTQELLLAIKNLSIEIERVATTKSVTERNQVAPQRVEGTTSGIELDRTGLRAVVPHKYAGGEVEDLEAWVFKMERIFRKTGAKEEETKLDLACEGLEGVAFQYFQVQFKAGKLMSWEQLVGELKRRFNHLKSPIQLRLKLMDMKVDTSLEKYVNDFLEIVNRIPDMSEPERIVAFVKGLPARLQKKLLQEKPEGLDEAMELAFINFEKVESWITKKGNQQERSDHKGSKKPETKNKSVSEIKCHGCGEVGHFKKNCPKATKWATQHVNQCLSGREDLVVCEAKVEGELVKAVFDTAATVSMISKSLVEKLNLKEEGSVEIVTPLGRGRVPKISAVKIEVCDSVVEIPVVVGEIEHGLLLGLDWTARTGAYVIPTTRRLVFPTRTIILDNMQEVVSGSMNILAQEEVFLAEVLESEPDVEEDMAWDFTPGDIPKAHTNECMDAEDVREVNKTLEEYRGCFCENIMDLGQPKVAPLEPLEMEKPVYKPPFRRARRRLKC